MPLRRKLTDAHLETAKLIMPDRHCRHPSIRTLGERFSLGASWVFSFQPVLPTD
jgi:hypothetical protein